MQKKNYVCCFGEMLWDMLPSGKMPGGAPMNVALHLQNLGIDSAIISRVGKDELGNEIKNFVQQKNGSLDWIQTDHIHNTGTVKVDVSDKTNVKYEIVQPTAWDFIEADNAVMAKVKEAFAIVYGTLACRQEQSRKALLQLLENTNALKIYDINLRPPFFSMELIQTLLEKADIAKLNEDELHIVAEQMEIKKITLEEKAKAIKEKFHLQKIIITRGSDGAMLIDNSGIYFSKIYKVNVKDTIGSGDSFLAGIIKNFMFNEQAEYALNYSCALGALVAQHHGANPPIKEHEILNMMEA